MRLSRVRFTVRRLMVAVAVAAWAFGYRKSLCQAPSPRSLLPPMTAFYLAWALLGSLRDILVVRRRAWFVLPALSLMFLSADWYHRRAKMFFKVAETHSSKAFVHRSSAQGGRGILILCGISGDGSRAGWSVEIPDAGGETGQARMGRLADFHEALAAKYERAGWFPWLLVAPDPPEPE